MSETRRERTLWEEIDQLDIPEDVKRRLVAKAERLVEKARIYRNALIELVREDL